MAGDYVYAAAGLPGLAVIDVHDPAAPALEALCDLPGSAHRVVVQGDRAYLTGTEVGVTVVDIADPSAPAVLDAWNPTSSTYPLAIAGDVGYVAFDSPTCLQPLRVRARSDGEIGDQARSLVVGGHDEGILKVPADDRTVGQFHLGTPGR